MTRQSPTHSQRTADTESTTDTPNSDSNCEEEPPMKQDPNNYPDDENNNHTSDNDNNSNNNNNSHIEDDDEESSIGDLSLYRLDFEDKPLAHGGEVLQPGDHIYLWCHLYQHHGIVLEATSSPPRLLIAEFTNAALAETPLVLSASHASSAVSTGVQGAFRFVEESEPSQWHKVRYQANPLECLTWRPGTCSGETPDPVQVVLTRVQFLQTCRHLIPDYHVLVSNCEAVALWCKTGHYTSWQAKRLLEYSKATLTGVVSATLFPMAGVMLGGLSVWHSVETNKRYEATTELLNREFAVHTMGKTPLTRQWIMPQDEDGNDKESRDATSK